MSHDLLHHPDTWADSPAAGGAGRRSWLRGPRARIIGCLLVVVAAVSFIAVRGLGGNFVYYLTPTDIVLHHKAQVGQQVRLGGYVVPGSVHQGPIALTFVVSDSKERMRVSDIGSVPQLFRAGQGVVLEGDLGTDGIFHANTLLVQHNGNYAPPKPGEAPPHFANLKGSG
ncbi:MAG TPA: cytochrome c maturation protein CcmE [Streptosporangiaceae bacterium]